MFTRDPGAGGKVLDFFKQAFGWNDGRKYDANSIATLGMSPQQQELNWRLKWYAGLQYAGYARDWDGDHAKSHLDMEVMTSAYITPPGFIDNSGSDIPVKLRRPRSPYQLARKVIDRFTGMLFGEKTHPRLTSLGDEATTDYLLGLLEAAHFWERCMFARGLGGATGTVGMGFKFVEGVPEIEVFDPRWIRPKFKDRDKLVLEAMEYRFMFPMDVEDEKEPGRFITAHFWDRRVITETHDITYKPVRVRPEQRGEPFWEEDQVVEHGFGFCPVIWIQNLAASDGSPYGECDIEGLHDMIREIDQLNSSATTWILLSCDPTLVFSGGNKPPSGLKKGSGNPIHLPQGTASYLESPGQGSKAASEQADACKSRFLECAECVLDDPRTAGPDATATEIEKRYGAMHNKVGRLRERWGDATKRLIEMMLDAIRILADRGEGVLIPSKVEKRGGKQKVTERQLGPGGYLHQEWPPLATPTLADSQMAVTTAGAALQSGVTTRERAVKWVAPYLGDEDPQATLEALEAQEAEAQAQQEAMMGGDEEGGDAGAAIG